MLTLRQHATILAALREWKRLPQIDRDNSSTATSDGELQALDEFEIDELYKYIAHLVNAAMLIHAKAKKAA